MVGMATAADVEGAEVVQDIEVPALEGVVNGVSVGLKVVVAAAEASVGEVLYVAVVAPRE